MVTMDNKENSEVTSEFPQQATLDQLVEEFYKVKKARSLIEVSTASRTKALSEKKHLVMWELKKQLDRVSKTKGDKIRKKLWDELGVVI